MTKKHIYYITRSYPPEFSGGGAIVREQSVNLLRNKGFTVTVVLFTPNPSLWLDNEDVIAIKINSKFILGCVAMEHLGLFNDYLSPWIGKAFSLLKNRASKDDLIFASSGGELACIALAVKLKNSLGCKIIANLHDPIDYTTVLGLRKYGKPHILRDKITKKLLSSVDEIVTSSNLYASDLVKNYSLESNIISHWYFGFELDNLLAKEKVFDGSNLTIVYAGNMNDSQQPQLLIESLLRSAYFSKINLHFFGSGKNADKIKEYSNIYDNVFFHGQMSQVEVHNFCIEYAHMGFVSLVGEYFRPFVPSKVYDYINLCLPMLGLLPDGDAKNLIEDNSFGIVGEKSEVLHHLIDRWFNQPELYNNSARNIFKFKSEWSMSATSRSMLQTIQEL